MHTENERMFANALNQSLHIGAASLKKIKKHFDNFENGWKAGFFELKRTTDSRELVEFRNKIDPKKEFEELSKNNVKLLFFDEFPALLKEIADPPELLYIKGKLPDENKTRLAVVGTRKFSSYGREVCEKIVNGLKDYNISIVSGLALGIDSIAHKSAVLNNLETIAVLGSGLHDSVLYPKANLRLSKEITEKGGCLVSEYALKMKAAQFTFPQRNRIAAGLSHGTLVVEAPKKSGALITANLALDYNREVFSVPGGIFNINSEGTNHLLKLGALPVTTIDDILPALGIDAKKEDNNINLTDEEKKIISLLYEPVDRDEIIHQTNMSSKEINPLLIQMEIKGIIKEIGGKIYPVKRDK